MSSRCRSIGSIGICRMRFAAVCYSFAPGDFNDAKRRAIGISTLQQWLCDVVHRNVVHRSSLWRTTVRMSMQDNIHWIANQRILKPTRAEEWENFQWLALYRCNDR